MCRSSKRAFTLVEMLVVVCISGLFFALLLPAVMTAREYARRASCSNNLVQLITGVLNYESTHRTYPSGTIASKGPIQNVNKGYHHSWITQLLPYIEQGPTSYQINRAVSVYHRANAPVRDLKISILLCPTSNFADPGYSSYAGVHHDIEAPIDIDNHGVFFLNSRVRRLDVSDGPSQTLFLGEKFSLAGDLGWMSGTRATLRNTGTPLNAIMRVKSIWSLRAVGPPGQLERDANDFGMMGGSDVSESGPSPDSAPSPEPQAMPPEADVVDTPDATTPDMPKHPAVLESGAQIVDGRPTTPTAVGGFESEHKGGAMFAFGDGSVRFIAEIIDLGTYQQLGHRDDGKLLRQTY